MATQQRPVGSKHEICEPAQPSNEEDIEVNRSTSMYQRPDGRKLEICKPVRPSNEVTEVNLLTEMQQRPDGSKHELCEPVRPSNEEDIEAILSTSMYQRPDGRKLEICKPVQPSNDVTEVNLLTAMQQRPDGSKHELCEPVRPSNEGVTKVNISTAMQKVDEPSAFNPYTISDDFIKTYYFLQNKFCSFVRRFEDTYTLDFDQALEEKRRGNLIDNPMTEAMLNMSVEVVWGTKRIIRHIISCLRKSLTQYFVKYNVLVDFSVSDSSRNDYAERFEATLERDMVYMERLLREGLIWMELLQEFKDIVLFNSLMPV